MSPAGTGGADASPGGGATVATPAADEAVPVVADVHADPAAAVPDAPVAADIIDALGPPPVMAEWEEWVEAVESLAVWIEGEEAGGWESWLAAAGLAALAGEIARRQVRRTQRAHAASTGQDGEGHGAD
jgi:hypothetical protein